MDEKIKVNDKRMFTPEGELRDPSGPEAGDGAAVGGSGGGEEGAESAPVREAASSERTESGPAAESARSAETPPVAGTPSEGPEMDLGARQGDLPEPTFTDLIGLLAQPIAMFLGDARLPGGEAEENLPLARFHIDLLDLLEVKTKGNISAQEAKLLENLLYQLRMRYIEKAG